VGRASRGHGQATPVCRRGLFRVQQGVSSSSQCGAWAGCMGCMGCMAGKGLGKKPQATQAQHVLSAEKMPLRLSVRETTARRRACSNCAAPRRCCLGWPTEAPALLGCWVGLLGRGGGQSRSVRASRIRSWRRLPAIAGATAVQCAAAASNRQQPRRSVGAGGLVV
jgi:hypothetical protein